MTLPLWARDLLAAAVMPLIVTGIVFAAFVAVAIARRIYRGRHWPLEAALHRKFNQLAGKDEP